MPAIEAAPQLLGCILERTTPQGILRLKIVETEAYHQDDPASHSFSGITKRTAPMFEASGTLYVYFTYGMHYCVNIVTGARGEGQAVLIRAAEPLAGIEIMKQNRVVYNLYKLANGPAKLASSLGIKNTLLSGKKIGPKTINILPQPDATLPLEFVTGPRIGISKAIDSPLRFYLKDNRFIS